MARQMIFEIKNDSNKPHLVPLENFTKIIDVLNQAVQQQAKAIVWMNEQEHLLSSFVSDDTDPKRHIAIPIPDSVDAKKLVETIKSRPDQSWYLAIFLPNQGVLGFKTKFIGESNQSLRFETPNKILIAQRRKDRRYRIPRGYEIHLQMGWEGTMINENNKRLYDLSSGGLSFTVDPKEEHVYKPGDVIDQIEMVLRGRRMIFSVEVKNKMPLPAGSPVPGVKIGTSFKKLTEQDEEYISAYVLEKTIQYLSK